MKRGKLLSIKDFSNEQVFAFLKCGKLCRLRGLN